MNNKKFLKQLEAGKRVMSKLEKMEAIPNNSDTVKLVTKIVIKRGKKTTTYIFKVPSKINIFRFAILKNGTLKSWG